MYSGKLVKYYDDLYNNKDYSIESTFIENNSKVNKVLDIGCGTGTHIENLYKDGRIFFGIDPSTEILEIASIKFRNHLDCHFKNCYVEEFTEESNFDTIISMFNVVNHILDRKDLFKNQIFISRINHNWSRKILMNLGFKKANFTDWDNDHILYAKREDLIRTNKAFWKGLGDDFHAKWSDTTD